MKSKLICLEGPNGVGKGTIINNLAETFNSKGISCRIFKDSKYPEMVEARKRVRERVISDPFEIIRTIAHARGQVYSRYLNMAREYLTLLDRGYYTSAVLQCQENIPISRIIDINLAEGIPIPDQTFILMTSLDNLIERIKKKPRNSINKYCPELLIKQITGYVEIASRYGECSLIDNSGSIDLTMTDIWRKLR